MRTSWLRLQVGFVVVYGVLAVGTALDPTARTGVLVLAAVLVAATCAERVQTGAAGAVVRARLGLGRPGVPAVAAALGVSLLVLSAYPLATTFTGAAVTLRPGWPWLLLGIFAVHGLAEELVWRGFLFRRLRDGRSFWSAVWWSTPFIAAAHLPIVLTTGPVVGVGAMLVAAVTAVPLSHLYEWGRRTLWAPALVHTAIDTFKLVEIPAGTTTGFSLAFIAVSLTVPLLVLALPRRNRPRLDAAVPVPARAGWTSGARPPDTGP